MQQRGGDPSAVKAPLQMGGLQRLPRVFPSTELLARAVKRTKFVKEDTGIKNARARSILNHILLPLHCVPEIIAVVVPCSVQQKNITAKNTTTYINKLDPGA